jgi:hypothetical protein
MNAAHAELIKHVLLEATTLLSETEAQLRAGKRSGGSNAALVSALEQLQQLNQWLPAGHYGRTALSKLSKVVPTLWQSQPNANVVVRLLSHCYATLHELQAATESATESAVALHLWCLHALAQWEQDVRAYVKPPTLDSCWQLGRWLQTLESTSVPKRTEPLLQEPLSLLQVQRWRQQWYQAVHGNAVDVVQASIDARLDAIVQLYRSHNTTRHIATVQLLAHECEAVAALLHWIANQQEQAAFACLAQELLYSLMQNNAMRTTPASRAVACWQAWWRFRWLRKKQVLVLATLAQTDQALLQAGRVDLQRYQVVLVEWDSQVNPAVLSLSYELMHQHYLLPWVLDAVQLPSLACLYHSWHQCLQLYWLYQQPIVEPLRALLLECANLLQASADGRPQHVLLLRLQLKLLRLWPLALVSPVPNVLLGAATPAYVTLSQVPLLIAKNLNMLTSIKPAWFESSATLAEHRTDLIKELQFLERGAAAVKVYAVEKLSSLLLTLHQCVQTSHLPWPADVLWLGHCHLLEILDEAAAWHVTAIDAAVAEAIEQWLSVAQVPTRQRERSEAAPQATALTAKLQSYIQQLSSTLGLHVRFSLEALATIDSANASACELSLQSVLRFILLEHANTLEQRRRQHKPAATSLAVQLKALTPTEAGAVQVIITEEGVDTMPTASSLQRVQRKLLPHASEFKCETVGADGRCFWFVVAPKASADA